MVGDKGGEVVWGLTTKIKEINIYIISFNSLNTTSQILLSPLHMWGGWSLEMLAGKWEAAVRAVVKSMSPRVLGSIPSISTYLGHWVLFLFLGHVPHLLNGTNNTRAYFMGWGNIRRIQFILFFYWLILERERKGGESGAERERERERERLVVLLISAFIGWFLYVPWPEIKLTTLAYCDDALTNWTTQPGQEDSVWKCLDNKC